MRMLENISSALADFYSLEAVSDGVMVNTHCMYPSNGMVRVYVRGSDTSCVVSDDWGAVKEISDAAGRSDRYDKLISSQAKKYGLKVTRGNIHTGSLEFSNVAGAIALVANASKEIARWLFGTIKPTRPTEFRVTLRSMLDDRFNGAVRHDYPILGLSKKSHSFENVIVFGDQKIIVDPVINDHASINSRLVANLDVQRADVKNVKQRIVYDDSNDWGGSDLSLLSIGAPVVGLSKVPDVLERLIRSVQ